MTVDVLLRPRLICAEAGVSRGVNLPGWGRCGSCPIDVVVQNERRGCLDHAWDRGIDNVVLEKAWLAARIGRVARAKGGRVGGRIPVESIVVNLNSVERTIVPGVNEYFSLLRQVAPSAVIGTHVIAENIVHTGSSTRAEKSYAIARGVMSVVVLYDIVFVEIVDVEVSTIAAPALVGVGFVVLNRAGMAIPLPQAYGSAARTIWTKATFVHDIPLQ